MNDTVVPESLKFTVPRYGPNATRKEFRLNPVASSYSTTGDNILRFFFNNSGIIDFRRGYIGFNVAITFPGGTTWTYARVANGIWTIFNRMRLTTGRELEDIREYNLLHTEMYECFREPDAADVVGPVYGFATQVERNALGGNTVTSYCCPCLIGLFNQGCVPMGLFLERLQLECWMDLATKFIETDANNPPIVTLTNIYFHYEVIASSAATWGKIVDLARGPGVCYPFRTSTYYTTSVSNIQNANLYIPHATRAIDAFSHVFRTSNTLTSMTTNDKDLTWIYVGPPQQWQLKLNNEYFPLEPAQVAADPQSYIIFLRWVGKWHLNGSFKTPPTISYNEYTNNRFVIVNELSPFPGEGLVSPITTEMAGNNVQLILNLAAPAPANTQMDTFAFHMRCIEFASGVLSVY